MSELNLDDLKPSLERIAIDPGTSFLGGGATSLFNGSDVTIGRVANPFDKAIDGMPDQAALIADLTNRVITNVSMSGAAYLGQKLGQLMTPPSISDIVNTAQSYLGKYVKTPGEILKNLQTEAEEEVEETLTKNINGALSNLNEEISGNMGNLKNSISSVTGDAQEWVSKINKYINQGPKWVISQVKMIDKQAREEIQKQIGEQTKKLEDKKQSVVNGLAESYARKTANVANEAIFNTTYDKLKKVLILKAKAENTAKGLAKQALMILKATLGQ